MDHNWQARLRGALIPAVPVPFDSQGRIDASAQEQYVAYMAAQPADGVAVWAHTGRGLLLERSQREQVLCSWRAGLGPGRLVVAGVGSSLRGDPADPAFRRRFIGEAVRMAEEAMEWGADMVMAYAPAAFRGSPVQDEAVVAYHAALAGTGAPLIAFYLYEAAGGVTYTLPVLRRLFALPALAGIKMATLDSVMTFQDVANLVRTEFPETVLITGEDRFLGYSLLCGAQAALVGMGAACVGLQKDLVRLWLAGEHGAFVRCSAAVDRLAQATFIRPMEGYIQRMLWVLALQGVIPFSATHDPWGPALDAAAEQAAIRQVLAEIGQL